MYIKTMKISTPRHNIRILNFHKGLNLIVDKTLSGNNDDIRTGNNVGKTTVLKLIDFCLGNDAKSLYQDPENKTEFNKEIKDFLIKNRIIITLLLVDDLDVPARTVEIRRNFLLRKERIFEVNGEIVGSKSSEINDTLRKAIFPQIQVEKPTFRQLISHNIRYEDGRLSNTLKTLGAYGSDEEYETLYLYMFGCDYNQGETRTRILAKKDKEEAYKRRLEKIQTKGAYKVALDVIDNDIMELERRKKELNVNPYLEKDIQKLNEIKVELNRLIGDLTAYKIRRSVIEDAEREMRLRRFDEDANILSTIYKQASSFIPNLQHSFEELVAYHNQMLDNRIKFMKEELPALDESITQLQNSISFLHNEERSLQSKITSSDTFADLEEIISLLTDLYKRKGGYESAISTITEVESSILSLNKQLQQIDENLFSEDFQKQINEQLAKFNVVFSSFSMRLYDEKYAIKCDPKIKKDKQVYKFASIDINFSTGKKQGEISCFDLAYTKFADLECIPCLHFLLNDKKELVHGNQLNKIAQIAQEENIQFVASILEDKLTPELRNSANYVIELSENDKLFRF